MESKFQLRLNQKLKVKTLKNIKQRKEGEIWQNR
nr:MAG TPA: 50S ribosomal protein L31 [Caudoviricetes sp.]